MIMITSDWSFIFIQHLNFTFLVKYFDPSKLYILSYKPSCLGSSGKELCPRTHPENTGFDFQEEQRLAIAHASTHELD